MDLPNLLHEYGYLLIFVGVRHALPLGAAHRTAAGTSSTTGK
ncbi:MAG TPA: hypothetical protein VEW08_03085 [Steroidobacteraceae bacterium]|nr:hypothetical protein [Steroidobacteraceae bacterium]